MFALTKRRKGAGASGATPLGRRTPAPWAASLPRPRDPTKTTAASQPRLAPAAPARGADRRATRRAEPGGRAPPSAPVHLKAGASLKAAASRKRAPGGRVPGSLPPLLGTGGTPSEFPARCCPRYTRNLSPRGRAFSLLFHISFLNSSFFFFLPLA